MGEQSIDILHKISQGYEEDVKGVIFGTAFLEVIRFPLVLPELTINENYLEGLHILGYFLFVLIASISIGLSIWVFVKRKTRVVKASQPFFLQMIIIGILIFSSAMVPLVFENTRHSQKAADQSCMAGEYNVMVPRLNKGHKVYFLIILDLSRPSSRQYHGS